MYAIWWLSQQDCEQIDSAIRWPPDEDFEPRETIAAQLSIPVYIAAEFRSRQGRAGRGRLWVSPEIEVKGVPWDDDDPICAMASVCGGIVIHAEHVPAIIALPGFVTDMQMQLWKVDSTTEAASLREAIDELLRVIDASPYGEKGIHHHTCPAPDYGKCTCGAYIAVDEARKAVDAETKKNGMRSAWNGNGVG